MLHLGHCIAVYVLRGSITLYCSLLVLDSCLDFENAIGSRERCTKIESQACSLLILYIFGIFRSQSEMASVFRSCNADIFLCSSKKSIALAKCKENGARVEHNGNSPNDARAAGAAW